MANINSRLDKIIPKIKEEKFIEGRGLGNEISFYVFDYEPENELLVRDYILHILKEFSHEGSGRRLIEFDLYKMLIEISKEKEYLKGFPKWKRSRGKKPYLKP